MRLKALQIILILIIDSVIVAFSSFIPLMLRFGFFDIETIYLDRVLMFLPVNIAIAIVVLALFKLYTRVWSFAGFSELLAAFLATIIIEAIYLFYNILFAIVLPTSFYPIQWLSLFILICGSRLSVRFYRQIIKRNRASNNKKGILVVGAGAAGSTIATEIGINTSDRRIVCFVDDNRAKKGKYLQGSLIAGNRYDIPALVEKYNVDEIIIAIPSACSSDMHDIIKICSTTPARLKILPGIMKGMKDSISQNIRDVNYEDLLGRNIIEINNEALSGFIESKTVLITGAGGSIGSELCRQILENNPKKLIMVDNYENSLYELSEEIKRYFPRADAVSLIASIQDENRINRIIKEFRPQIIFHAAAHKHVPLMEDSPCEAVKNNCGGTLVLAKLADKYKVEHFILISTDKAVRPTNVMGATKRICEMIIQAINQKSKTRFVAVRFGNVLGSNGSVVPLFLKQIEEGGPVTLTHKSITRFFMTIPEAISLVLQASLPSNAGELFVLDMGEPVKIYDLAENLIKLEGLVPEKDIKIEIIGLRPGEKLYEEILIQEEGLEKTHNDLIFVEKPAKIDETGFFEKLEKLISSANSNSPKIIDEIATVCDTYRKAE